jgi:hypothetical protein
VPARSQTGHVVDFNFTIMRNPKFLEECEHVWFVDLVSGSGEVQARITATLFGPTDLNRRVCVSR